MGDANNSKQKYDGSSVISTITIDIITLSQKPRQKSQSSILAISVKSISSHWSLSQYLKPDLLINNSTKVENKAIKII